jgi:hypothetical protein
MISAAELQDPTHPQIYKIDEGFPPGEYLLIENRQPLGFESRIPQGGLAIFHIDESAALNTEGYPGQALWPNNGQHYKVALIQADGEYHLERGVGRGDSSDVFHARGVSELLPFSDVDTFPNTDSYKSGIVLPTSNRITDISDAGIIMSFKYKFGDPDSEPTSAPTDEPTMSPSSNPTSYCCTNEEPKLVAHYGPKLVSNEESILDSHIEHMILDSKLSSFDQFSKRITYQATKSSANFCSKQIPHC